jgi:hypothetical protein
MKKIILNPTGKTTSKVYSQLKEVKTGEKKDLAASVVNSIIEDEIETIRAHYIDLGKKAYSELDRLERLFKKINIADTGSNAFVDGTFVREPRFSDIRVRNITTVVDAYNDLSDKLESALLLANQENWEALKQSLDFAETIKNAE